MPLIPFGTMPRMETGNNMEWNLIALHLSIWVSSVMAKLMSFHTTPHIDAHYLYENVVVMLLVSLSPWDIMRWGAIPCCADLTSFPASKDGHIKEFMKWLCFKIRQNSCTSGTEQKLRLASFTIVCYTNKTMHSPWHWLLKALSLTCVL